MWWFRSRLPMGSLAALVAGATVAGVVFAGWRGALTGLVASATLRSFVKAERGVTLLSPRSRVGVVQRLGWLAIGTSILLGCWYGGWRDGWKYSLLGMLAVLVVLGPLLVYLLLRATPHSKAHRLSSRLAEGDAAALEELLDVVEAEPSLVAVLRRRDAARADVRAVYRTFEASSGRTRIKGTLACAAALVDPNLLDVLLARSPDIGRTAQEILAYFHGQPIAIPGEVFDDDPEDATIASAASEAEALPEPVQWPGLVRGLLSMRRTSKLRRLFEQGRYQEVIDVVDRAGYRSDVPRSDATGPLNAKCGSLLRLGRYAEAIACAEVVVDLARRARSDDDDTVHAMWQRCQEATALGVLAAARMATGDRVEAARGFLEAVALLDRACGSPRLNESQTAGAERARIRCLENLGALRAMDGGLAEAEQLYRSAIAHRIRLFGPTDEALVDMYRELAAIDRRRGRMDQAAQHLARAIEIGRLHRVRGPESFLIASRFCLERGLQALTNSDAANAAMDFGRAVELIRRGGGEMSLDAVSALANWALALRATGSVRDALAAAERAVAVSEALRAQVFSTASERQRQAFLNSTALSRDVYLEIVDRHFRGSDAAVGALCNWMLRTKALAAEASRALTENTRGLTSELAPAHDELKALRAAIAAKELMRPGYRARRHKQLVAWTERADRLEREIAARVPAVRLDRELRELTAAAIAARLPARAALVEIVQAQLGTPRYLGFVIEAGAAGPALIDLGRCDTIDRDVDIVRGAITGRGVHRDIEPGDQAGTGAGELAAAGDRLRGALVEPLLPLLSRVEHLFLAPDGKLTQLPFEVIPLDDAAHGGDHVIDQFQISYVVTARDVLRFSPLAAPRGTAVVIADPDFDLGPGTMTSEARFAQLPGSRREGEAIARRLGVQPLVGPDAREDRLKQLTPSVLHIATHGFFLEDPPRPDPAAALQANDVARLTSYENPLLRSGIALAGANQWAAGQPLPGGEDGIVTSADVATMDLSATELVVLSACHTGSGSLQVGEGVQGLRSAFVAAGARALVMSLWTVPDEATVELMSRFYDSLLTGTPRAAALRDAQLALKRQGADVLAWGGFVCQGDPGPLGQDLLQQLRSIAVLPAASPPASGAPYFH